MKTQIANTLTVFLLIICVILLSVLLFRGPEKQKNVRKTAVVQAIETAMPSVVNLTARKVQEEGQDLMRKENAGAEIRVHEGISLGSGSIIDSSGLVVTNAHVVHQASEVWVTLSTGAAFSATVIAEDLQNDVALLKIRNAPAILPVIRTARPGEFLLGETVIAVGNPFGLDGTITVGVLSGANRSLRSGSKLLFSDLLQTDAAVFPGNSGGPLINLEGSMIGMNMAVRKNSPGIGFAIPLMRLENVLAGFLLPEKMISLSLGIQPGMRPDGTVYIEHVFPESPAAEAGVIPGETLDQFNNFNPEGNLLELLRKMIRLTPGDEVVLKTGGKKEKIVLHPVSMNRDGIAAAERLLGISVSPLTEKVARSLNYPIHSGFVVTDVRKNGPVRAVSRGDILLNLGGFHVNEPDDLVRALAGKSPGDVLPAVLLSTETIPNQGTYLVKRDVNLTVL